VSFPVRNVSSAGQRRPAMVMKYVMVAGRPRRRPAQVEGELIRAGDQPADQQVLALDRRDGHRPVAVARAFRPVPARAPLEHGVRHGLISSGHRAGRQGNLVVTRDDRHVGEPGPGAFLRSSSLRPHTSSNAAHVTGSPAAVSRPSCCIASCGLVANCRSAGIPAARRRGMSRAQRPGMYTSKSAQACPLAVT
jgi:hypothetical protein